MGMSSLTLWEQPHHGESWAISELFETWGKKVYTYLFPVRTNAEPEERQP